MFDLFRRVFGRTLTAGPSTPGRTVSIVIPTYNRADALPATLDGLLLQTHPNFEVVVVVGPCTDTTRKVLARYPTARLVDCPEARVGIARNIGVEAATGDIIVFLDDDAVPRSGWLERLVAAYDDPGVGAAGGFVWDTAKTAMQWRICTCTREGAVDTDAPGLAIDYQQPGADPFLYLAGCNMSVRRELIVQAGGFDEALSSGYDDTDICRWLIDAGWRIALIEDALVDHGYAKNAVRDAEREVRDPYWIVHSYAVFIGHNPPPGATPETLRALVRQFAENWRNSAKWKAQTGLLSVDGMNFFLARIDEAERQGLLDAARPRYRRPFPVHRQRTIRSYRDGLTPVVSPAVQQL